MTATTNIISSIVLTLGLTLSATAVQAVDCDAAAASATKLFAAKASKDDAAYASAKKSMLAQPDDKHIYAMLVRAVDEGLYSSPEAMEKAAVRYCSRKLAAN